MNFILQVLVVFLKKFVRFRFKIWNSLIKLFCETMEIVRYNGMFALCTAPQDQTFFLKLLNVISGSIYIMIEEMQESDSLKDKLHNVLSSIFYRNLILKIYFHHRSYSFLPPSFKDTLKASFYQLYTLF